MLLSKPGRFSVRCIPAGGVYFVFIGGLGFLIDGGMLIFLNSFFNLDIYISRLFSFLLATLITWYLNRKYSFKKDRIEQKRAGREYLRYFIVQVGGGFLNLIVFITVIHFFLWMKNFLLVPLAIGAIFGLVFNYSFSRYWVFR